MLVIVCFDSLNNLITIMISVFLKTIFQIYLILMISFFLGCTTDNSKMHSQSNNSFQLKLNNDKIEKAISDYIIENTVDSKERVISLRVQNCGEKQVFSIAQFKTKLFLENQPDYYFIHNNETVVIVFLGGNKFLSSSQIKEELLHVLNERGISLSEERLDYNPPRWELITCGDQSELRKKYDPFLFNFLPCEYDVRQDSTNLGKYDLVKKE